MGKLYDTLDGKLSTWIARQSVFFVATAPSGAGGHVNVSPKGPIESFRVLDPSTVAYLDLIGSGVETIAHLRDNGRIVIMFCAFAGPPRIVRLHGRGEVLQPGAAEFGELWSELGFDALTAAEHASRSIIRVRLERISDSCGFLVPRMEYAGQRPQQPAWVDRKLRSGGIAALHEYVASHNAESIDGLPGIAPPGATA